MILNNDFEIDFEIKNVFIENIFKKKSNQIKFDIIIFFVYQKMNINISIVIIINFKNFQFLFQKIDFFCYTSNFENVFQRNSRNAYYVILIEFDRKTTNTSKNNENQCDEFDQMIVKTNIFIKNDVILLVDIDKNFFRFDNSIHQQKILIVKNKKIFEIFDNELRNIFQFDIVNVVIINIINRFDKIEKTRIINIFVFDVNFVKNLKTRIDISNYQNDIEINIRNNINDNFFESAINYKNDRFD